VRLRRAALAGVVLVASLLMASVLRHRERACRSPAPPSAGAAWVFASLGAVPCPPSRLTAYGARDDQGAPLDALDPIADPRGGYLGVYHVPRPRARGTFDVMLARSFDLVHWRRIRLLVPGAAMATLRAVPGTGRYMLAVERDGPPNTILLAYYPSLRAVLSGHPASGVDLPLRLSRRADGTPAFDAIAWNGSLARSVLTLTFHYLNGAGVDREAVGVVRGFRPDWRTRPDLVTDSLLSQEGFAGNHGDGRLFAVAGQPWRVLEAQRHPRDFASWQVVVYDAAARRYRPITFHLRDGTHSASFGNPIVAVLPAARGGEQVLVVTVFVFSAGPAAADAGELVYHRPRPGAAGVTRR
jgi:hypothetical protein